ncbi:MAG: hypothetical protein FAF03_07280 [Epsilonproteobacteria bacterium]|nr:hypothetical protein [Campylobacterota bacterium]
MMQEIENAKYSIDMCTYVFQFDTMTETMLEALTQQAKKGVKVRLLLDLVGSLGAYFNQRGFKVLKNAGGRWLFLCLS